MLVREVADDPLCYHELVCSILSIYRKELDLILLIDLAVDSEVSYLRVTILDLSSSLCYVCHALCAEFVELCIWGRFMVAFLVCCREHFSVRCNHVVLKLSHCLKLHSCDLVECSAGFAECLLR